MQKQLRLPTRFLFALFAILVMMNTTVNHLYAQSPGGEVIGVILDVKGLPIPGATIKNKSTAKVAISDGNGRYKISVAKGETLVYTFVGYETQSVLIDAQAQIKITLIESSDKMLNDVVVIGYGTQKRSDVTGSVVSVPKARLSQLPVTNVLQSIEGAVAGVNVTTTSSVPGSQPSALIRGQNSINANSGPYVVVDGIPLTKTAVL